MTYPPFAILLNLAAAPRDALKAGGVRSSRVNRSSLTLATLRDLFSKPEEPFEQRFRTWRATGDVHVDGHHRVDALEGRVAVPEFAPGRRAVAHGDDPFRLGHLLVEAAKAGGHLMGDGARDDHDVCLPRARAEDLHAET